ncbi:MAG: hypothetical protein Q8Q54_01475 [Methylococcales bacterium]|nr:hypothetical protein [Methylococcales bacterium]MDP3009462.1 hypothetical protein [Methylococcales bacterium]MDP3837570.1 hypothetical protein [Methylococcales bacterium]
MKNFAIASVIVPLLLIALRVSAETPETDQAKTHVAGTPIDQSHPGSTMSTDEQATAKHLATSVAYEQAAIHHKAAANAKTAEERAEHAKAADKASLAACEKSKDAPETSK